MRMFPGNLSFSFLAGLVRATLVKVFDNQHLLKDACHKLYLTALKISLHNIYCSVIHELR